MNGGGSDMTKQRDIGYLYVLVFFLFFTFSQFMQSFLYIL